MPFNRNIALKLRVSEQEYEHIVMKRKLAKCKNIQSYLLKMAIDGHIISVDMSPIQELVRLLSINSNKINQIAHKLNSGLKIYEENVNDIKRRNNQLWNFASEIIEKLERIL